MPAIIPKSKRGNIVGHTLIEGQPAEIRERTINGYTIRTACAWSTSEGEPVVLVLKDVQLAQLLQVSVKTVWRWVNRGDMLSSDVIDGEACWNLAEVLNWLNEDSAGKLLNNLHADEWFHETAGTETPPENIEKLVAERRKINND